MKIVADENLAFTDYFFQSLAIFNTKAGRTLTHADVKDAQALLVRSVTVVNASLIENTALKYVGSANNRDRSFRYCSVRKQGITWANAAGCNAQAVAEYVITALVHLDASL